MGGQYQILRKQLPGEAAFHEARDVGKEEHSACPSANRQHAGLGIAVPCPGIGLGMEHDKVHPIPAPATPPMAGRSARTEQLRPWKGRPDGRKAARVVPVPMGEQHPIELLHPEGAQRRLNLDRKGRCVDVAPGGPRIHQHTMLRRFYQGSAPLPHVEHGETKGPGR